MFGSYIVGLLKEVKMLSKLLNSVSPSGAVISHVHSLVSCAETRTESQSGVKRCMELAVRLAVVEREEVVLHVW